MLTDAHLACSLTFFFLISACGGFAVLLFSLGPNSRQINFFEDE